MVSDVADLLIKEFGEKKIKISKDYLDKYGRDCLLYTSDAADE